MVAEGFKNTFGAAPDVITRVPGRVNLIGEHIDYNSGAVLPMALPIGLAVGLKLRADDNVRIASQRFDGVEERRLGDEKTENWADYAMGAVEWAVKNGIFSAGADLFVDSSIPDGAGLSSSAALIVAILKAARGASHHNISDIEIALLAQQVENDYIGVPCGIMDQMAVAAAPMNQAMLLNTKSLDYDIIDPPTDHRLAVVHSGVHRKLSDGRYGERKRECAAASEALGNHELCLLTETEQQKAADLPAPLDKRVRHCLSEHRRVLAAAQHLREGDMKHFGALMNESHASMRDDFEMSHPAIDALAESAVSLGATGARLTGGGFGGCIVAAVPAEIIETWKAALLTQHPDAALIC